MKPAAVAASAAPDHYIQSPSSKTITFDNFITTREQQIARHGRHRSPFDEHVDVLTWTSCQLAIGDHDSLKSDSDKVRVVSAPTGSGKTMSTLAFAATMLRHCPEYSCAFIVETVKQAQELHDELVHMVDPGEIVVWTRAHDTKAKPSDNLSDHGFDPAVRHAADELPNARCIIITHAKFIQPGSMNPEAGVRYFKSRQGQERQRTNLFIDEHPQMAKLIEMTPGDMMKFRDMFKREYPDHELGPVIDQITERMDDDFSSKGVRYSSTSLIEFAEYVTVHLQGQHSLKLLTTNQNDSRLFQDAMNFLRAASVGYVFLSRQAPRAFVAYDLQFKGQPGTIILDATADLSGYVLLMPNMAAVDVPGVNYSNLEVFHVELPSTFKKKVVDIVSKKSTAEPYAQFIRQTVLDNTKPGDRVLLVTHRALLDHDYITDAPDPDDPEDWSGRAVTTLHWGTGIGSNKFKAIDNLFLFGEFFIPGKTVIGNVLAMKDLEAHDKHLRQANGQGMQGDFKTFYEGHLLRWTKQLASRGSIRNIDDHGNAKPMKLFTTMDLGRLVRNQEKMFPGSEKAKLIYPDGSLRRGKSTVSQAISGKDCLSEAGNRPVDRLTELLGNSTEALIRSDVVEGLTGIPSRNLPKAVKSDTVAPHMAAFGWELVSAKDVGEKGKRKFLVRKDYLTERAQ